MIARKHQANLLILIGVIGLIVGGTLYVQQQIRSHVSPGVTALGSNPAPSSAKLKPETVASYNVPAPDPKYIAIPSIHVSNTPVIKLGLLRDGTIATPDNIYETGWYNASSLPGQTGAMFIYGHVSSWSAKGVFYNLKDLKPSSQITITRGDNLTYTYQVASTKIYPYNNVNMNEVLAPVKAGTPGLNLMTCTGQVIKGTSEFNERLVVFASLVTN